MVDNTEGAHKISVVEGVFTEEQRKKILEECKPLLIDGDILSLRKAGKTGLYPGRQSYPTVHLHPDFKGVHDRFVDAIKQATHLDIETTQSWINWSDGSQDLNWHTHSSQWCAVYYLKTFPFLKPGNEAPGE